MVISAIVLLAAIFLVGSTAAAPKSTQAESRISKMENLK